MKLYQEFLLITAVGIGLLLTTSCGKKSSVSSNIVDLNKKTIVIDSPKSNLIIDSCESMRGELLCMCIDRNAYKECNVYKTHANGKEYNDCITPYINRAYNNYCNINRVNAYNDYTLR